MAAYLVGAEAEAAPYRLDILRLAHVLTPTLGLFLVCHFYTRGRDHSESDLLQRISLDPLTKLGNRDKLIEELEREQQRVRHTDRPLSRILIDLDHFKRINGHDSGDAVLVFSLTY